MPKSAEYMNLPFDEAIDFFRQKVDLPTRTWKDLWQGMHSRGFVSAGAMKNELLADLHGAVQKGLDTGSTLADFKKEFGDIVTRHGWKYKGGKAWRAATIFNTNLSTAYSAGHYKQMTDPAVLAMRPLWRYVASGSAEPRVEHIQWYNLVLPADDPFWNDHTPPNGWGCKCGVVSHSAREVERLKKEEASGPYPVRTKAPKKEYYEWTDKKTGEILRVPKGIDPGWDYNPGKAAWGERISQDAMNAWRAQGAKAYERLTPGAWDTAGRPELITVDRPVAKVGKAFSGTARTAAALKKTLGGDEKIFSFKKGSFRYDIVANANAIAEHLPEGRTPFIPFIPEALEDPFEVWMSFERHKGTGKYELRQRIIKAVELDRDRAVLMVAQANAGRMEAWTMIPTSDLKYVNNQRQGKLIWAR